MTYYVYSTLSCTNEYAIYQPGPDLPQIVRKIVIKGGHGVADSKHIITPNGVVTEVSDEDMAYLETDYVFKMQRQNGFLKVEKKKIETEEAVRSMASKDRSAPKTPDDPEYKDDNETVAKPMGYKRKKKD